MKFPVRDLDHAKCYIRSLEQAVHNASEAHTRSFLRQTAMEARGDRLAAMIDEQEHKFELLREQARKHKQRARRAERDREEIKQNARKLLVRALDRVDELEFIADTRLKQIRTQDMREADLMALRRKDLLELVECRKNLQEMLAWRDAVLPLLKKAEDGE